MLHTSDRGSRGRVLVTDGEFKHTLGIARALAAAGHEVHVVAASTRAPAVHSRAVHAWHPAPRPDDPAYPGRLLEIAAGLGTTSVIAVGNGAVAACDRLRDRWPAGARTALPSPESLAIANDKSGTAALARGLGLRTIEEIAVATLEEAQVAWRRLGSPLVLKSALEEGRKALRYVRDETQLEPAFAAVKSLARGGVVAQRYVAGDGWGMSALYRDGARQRVFMHRRVREWPPSGGTSACAESVPECAPLERAGTALLDALHWHGVAMVEFKGDPAAGTLTLIEINAKFWGSHDLALAAGVCFPCDLVAMLAGRELAPQPPVRRVRFSWPLGGDLWHGLVRPAALPGVLWDAVSPAVAHSFRVLDPLPHCYELAQWARSTPGAMREFRELR